MKKLLLLLGIISSVAVQAQTVTLIGVISQPASRAGYFLATNNKSYCFGDCVDDRVGEKMINTLTKAGCSNGMPMSPSDDNDCIIKVKLNNSKNTITKVISAKKNSI